MPRKSAPKPKRKVTAKRKTTDPAQYKRFLEAAKAVEASDDPQVFDQAFKKVARKRAP